MERGSDMARVYSVNVIVRLDGVEATSRQPTEKDAKEIVRTAMQMLHGEGYDNPDVAFDFDMGLVEFKGKVE
jgi:hypothetical protein